MRILIVEDEEELAKSLKKGLEKEGYAVDYVTDGESAERRIEIHSQDYDIIILDLMLPGKDGSVICKNAREKNITTPIIILTARDEVEDKIGALDCGADDYLVKPFSFEELLARLRALLRRPEHNLPTELRTQGLSLNTNTRKAFCMLCGGTEILLTLKEFRLLEYLMRHPNEVVEREQILSHVWDFNFDSFSNVVDVHIKNLRKKLNHNNHDEKILETVRGIGYRIKA